jgi:FkbH-like protein
LAQAAELRSGFASQEDYLRSLAVVVTLRRNDLTQVARIAELIGKSNQFNLTTQRLSAGEVAALMSQDGVTVYSFAVTDRLADHGLAGVLITVGEGDAVRVHSFLMSCRVIGRGAEFAVWRTVVNDALSLGKRHLLAAYRPTAKNAQVADFYDRLGLHGSDEVGDGSRSYTVQLEQFQLPPTTGVELRNA